MRYYQVILDDSGRKSVLVESNGRFYDLSNGSNSFTNTIDLFKSANDSEKHVDEVSSEIIKNQKPLDGIQIYGSRIGVAAVHLETDILSPVDAPEVWAFGVTYMDSMKERQAESGVPDVYAQVYNADRPEAFFKGTKDRIQNPGDLVGIRGDSNWNVPEPELAFMLIDGKIVGYTVGNDMSSRAIEGENPLYLPQAKVYDKSLALGPCISSTNSVPDPQNLFVSMTIYRGDGFVADIMNDSNQIFKGTANTSQMKRNCEYLADWLQRHNHVPDGTVVLTGTGIIPPTEFTLQKDDIIKIEIENIGILSNRVTVV
ncbi:MAG: fumarylacetoacetate hydrolase [SAR202 cluster bacterium]|jgi:2-dehydro-3-deoxy-D-arabinonate dehydratase|nr:fumarylacetoacetate hydrolase family protein [Dehalococcoidia bacterium]MDP7232490.1 fumarylacetoacetate hydrolase family protein [Dehalococcoidia bacterium]MDP7612471.1 fumarylacetoacetate hydrolase family protein [Dehalococcoidia bacterium]MQG47233.1 fumarylacetoacetate hydrolase [SAR202 cluster bacterium]|tara:strand:- start:425 stop:1366 length:942 start_codon:yes stop_codon:yes gene_type:complete